MTSKVSEKAWDDAAMLYTACENALDDEGRVFTLPQFERMVSKYFEEEVDAEMFCTLICQFSTLLSAALDDAGHDGMEARLAAVQEIRSR